MKKLLLLTLLLVLITTLCLSSCNILRALFGTPDVVPDDPSDDPPKTSTENFIVKFVTDSIVTVPNQIIKSGECIEQPIDPFKDGYIFKGWYYGDEEWDFSTPVTADMTLVAKWEIDSARCSHKDADKDGSCDLCQTKVGFNIVYMDGTTTLNYDAKYTKYSILDTTISLPVATKDHHDFLGWFTDPTFSNPVTSVDVPQGGDVVFYAKFVPTTYTIEYKLNDGVNASGNPTYYTISDLPITLSDPTRDGYSFAGWYTDNAFTNQFTEINADNIGNLVLHARWGSKPFKVTYLDHNGDLLLEDTMFVSESDQPLRSYTEFPSINEDGYYFIAWVDANNESKTYVSIPAGNYTDIVVKASLENEAVHKISYYVDGEYFATGSFRELDGLGLNDLYIPTKGGYSFDGWYSDAAYTTKVKGIAPNTTEDVSLYGKFTPNEYNVSFTIDGVSFDGGFTKYTVSSTGTLLPAIPAKEGHVVLGWYTEDGRLMEENKIAGGAFGDLVLHAVYEKLTYKITYHLGGGTNDDRNVTVYSYGELPELYQAEYKEGYKFAGWYTDAAFSSDPLLDLTGYANKDISLFALWIPDLKDGNTTETPAVPF